jgi:hypothetical protein
LRVRLGGSAKEEAAVNNGSDSELNPPEEIHGQMGIPGDGRDLAAAIENAWENAKGQ